MDKIFSLKYYIDEVFRRNYSDKKALETIISGYGWINKCIGHTKKECFNMGIIISDSWMKEVEGNMDKMFVITFENVLGHKLYFCPDRDFTDVLSDEVVWENYTQQEMEEITKRLNFKSKKRGDVFTFKKYKG